MKLSDALTAPITLGRHPIIKIIIAGGLPGKPGLSAYQVAVADGFVGTVTQWLDSLHGDAGYGSGDLYLYGGFAVSNILTSEVLMEHEVRVAHTLPNNFLGCGISAGSFPETPWTAIVRHNDVDIGTFTLNQFGQDTLNTIGQEVEVAVGDIITLVAPEAQDPDIGRVRFTFKGIV